MPTNNLTHAKRFAHALKGPGFSCLFIMLVLNRATGSKELAPLTGYNRRSISKGLSKLSELGLAVQNGRYDSWCLTTEGYQLSLNPQNSTSLIEGKKLPLPPSEGKKLPLDFQIQGFLPPKGEEKKLPLPPIEGKKLPLPPSEGEKLPLPLRSSSSTINKGSINQKSLKQLQLLPKDEGGKLPLPIPENLTNLLIFRCGCPRRRAEPALQTAIDSGEHELEIELNVLRWLAYCQSERGKGINNPGIFIAAKVEHSEPPAEFIKAKSDSDLEHEILDLERELEKLNGDGNPNLAALEQRQAAAAKRLESLAAAGITPSDLSAWQEIQQHVQLSGLLQGSKPSRRDGDTLIVAISNHKLKILKNRAKTLFDKIAASMELKIAFEVFEC